MNEALEELCDVYGIIPNYLDGIGERKSAPNETCIAILNGFGLAINSDADITACLADAKHQRSLRCIAETNVLVTNEASMISTKAASGTGWQVVLEDGNEVVGLAQGGAIELPPLPLGLHMLRVQNDCCLLLSAPESLPTPKPAWGVMVPLYGLNSGRKNAVGDYVDLKNCAQALENSGASFVGINPIHAGFPNDPSAFSPYSPSSRKRLNTLHIATQHERADELNAGLIDYRPAIELQMATLLREFEALDPDGDWRTAFVEFREDEGQALQTFATHQALSQQYGAYWPDWPSEYQDADSAAVAKFAIENPYLVEFHAWLQWRADQQLTATAKAAEAAGLRNGLYLDLAVGTHPAGAETWADGDVFVRKMSIGSPSDSFSADGQNWGLAPLSPIALRAANFGPLVDTLRAQFRYAGILRIDHILGFERSLWIPDGLPGAYVRMPRDEMLAILRIEATRADVVVVGEDLGNVPTGLRDALDTAGILGCRVVVFERNWHGDRHFTPPEEYSENALASIGTHDLPTLKGWWAGRDIDWRHKLGQIDGGMRDHQHYDRNDDRGSLAWALQNAGLAEGTENDGNAPMIALHGFLAKAKSALVAVQIEDVLALDEQPNLPGTVYDHPNWRRRLPLRINQIFQQPLFLRISKIMDDAGRTVAKTSK